MADDDVLQLQAGHQVFAPSPGGGPGGAPFAGAKLTLNGDQALGTNVDKILDQWTLEKETEAGAYYVPGDHLDRLLAPSAGYYRVTAHVRVTNSPGGGYAYLELFRADDTAITTLFSTAWTATGINTWSFVWEGEINQAGSYARLVARATTAGRSALGTTTFLAIQKLAD